MDKKSQTCFMGRTVFVLPRRLMSGEKDADMNRAKMQLELSLEVPNLKLTHVDQRSRRLAKARWWFAQMHTVVDRAFDWSTPPAPEPEQIRLTLAQVQ